jgi:hypothetical protein
MLQLSPEALANVRSGMVTESADAAARCADERGTASGDIYMHAQRRIGAHERDIGHVLEPVCLRRDRVFLRYRIEDSQPHCGKQRGMCRQVVGTSPSAQAMTRTPNGRSLAMSGRRIAIPRATAGTSPYARLGGHIVYMQ